MIKNLLENFYHLKNITVESFNNGNSSSVYKITSPAGTLVFKSNQTLHIAETEFDCLEHLSKKDLSPEPIKTAAGSKTVFYQDSFYFLMTYIDTVPLLKQDINLSLLGRALCEIHDILSDIDLREPTDRFSETEMILSVKDKALQKEFVQILEDHDYFKDNQCAVIHGDMGNWNILYTNHRIQFIDFADVRFGSPCFDLAAIIDSYQLNNKETEILLKGYGVSSNDIQNELTLSLKKWQFRGILFMAANDLLDSEQLSQMLKSI